MEEKEKNIPPKKENNSLDKETIKKLYDSSEKGEVYIGDFDQIEKNRAIVEAEEKAKKIEEAIKKLEKIENISLQKNGNKVSISPISVAAGKIVVLKSNKTPNLKTGQKIKINTLDQLGELQLMEPQISVIFHFGEDKIFYITPINFDYGVGVVGKIYEVTKFPEVKNISASKSGGKLFLDWEWPKEVDEVYIEQSFTSFHKDAPNSPNVIRYPHFHRDEFDYKSGFVIQKLEPQDYYFTIYTVQEEDGKSMLSEGVNFEYSNYIIELRYLIKKTRFSKSRTLIIEANQAGLQIPNMKLVRSQKQFLKNANQGELMFEIPSFTINESRKNVFEIDRQFVERGYFASLFLEDEKNYNKYRIVAASKEERSL